MSSVDSSLCFSIGRLEAYTSGLKAFKLKQWCTFYPLLMCALELFWCDREFQVTDKTSVAVLFEAASLTSGERSAFSSSAARRSRYSANRFRQPQSSE